jgi:hypothetical protein
MTIMPFISPSANSKAQEQKDTKDALKFVSGRITTVVADANGTFQIRVGGVTDPSTGVFQINAGAAGDWQKRLALSALDHNWGVIAQPDPSNPAILFRLFVELNKAQPHRDVPK